MRIVLSAEAVTDLERLRDFLIEKDPRAATRASATLATGFRALPGHVRIRAVSC